MTLTVRSHCISRARAVMMRSTQRDSHAKNLMNCNNHRISVHDYGISSQSGELCTKAGALTRLDGLNSLIHLPKTLSKQPVSKRALQTNRWDA